MKHSLLQTELLNDGGLAFYAGMELVEIILHAQRKELTKKQTPLLNVAA